MLRPSSKSNWKVFFKYFPELIIKATPSCFILRPVSFLNTFNQSHIYELLHQFCGVYLICSLHILSSLIDIRLHTKNQLHRLLGSGSKVCVGWYLTNTVELYYSWAVTILVHLTYAIFFSDCTVPLRKLIVYYCDL